MVGSHRVSTLHQRIYGHAGMSVEERKGYCVWVRQAGVWVDLRMALTTVLTFVSYAMYHTIRIGGFSGVKPALKEKDSFTAERLGAVDTGFLFAYALGQFVFGRFADLLQPKRTLALGMFAVSCLSFLEGLMGWLGVQGTGVGFVGWLLMRIIEGLFHATGWTSSIAILGNWFPESGRGLVFGIWSASSNSGDIVGLNWAAVTLATFGEARWYWVPWSLAAVMLAMAAVNVILLRTAPFPWSLNWHYDEAGPPGPEVGMRPLNEAAEEEQRTATIREVLQVPGLLHYAFTFMFLKLVNYALFLWLPFFLSEEMGLDKAAAARLSTLFDWGFIVGGIVAGLLSDVTSRVAGEPMRSPVVSLFLLLSVVPLGRLPTLHSEHLLMLLCFTCGVLQGGPAEALTSSVSVDLGKHPSLKGRRATSTCTGVIDGTGAVGAACGQYLVGMLSDRLGWRSVFTFLMTCLACAFVLSLLRLRMELTRLRRRPTCAGHHEATASPGATGARPP